MINFEEFLKYYVKKWKMVTLEILVFVILFVGATQIVGKEITVPHSEEYLYYEKELNWHREYMEKSILMKVNPTRISVETLLIDNITDEDGLKNYVISADIWEDFQCQYEKKYLPELVRWNENLETKSVELALRHLNEDECKKTIHYLEKKIGEYDANLRIRMGASRIEVDDELQFLQNDWYSRIEFLENVLEEAEAGFTIKINTIAAAITGGLIGAVVSALMVLIMYVTKRTKD